MSTVFNLLGYRTARPLHLSQLTVPVSGYGYWLAPLAACMCIDYYVMKKGNLSLPDLFNGTPSSRYWYTRGVNYRAVVSVILALIPCLPSFAAQIAPDGLGLSTTATNLFYISFMFTYALASLIYYVSYLVFPEKGENIVERSLRWEQWADENDEAEMATATLGVAEDGASQSSHITRDEDKKVSAA